MLRTLKIFDSLALNTQADIINFFNNCLSFCNVCWKATNKSANSLSRFMLLKITRAQTQCIT